MVMLAGMEHTCYDCRHTTYRTPSLQDIPTPQHEDPQTPYEDIPVELGNAAVLDQEPRLKVYVRSLFCIHPEATIY